MQQGVSSSGYVICFSTPLAHTSLERLSGGVQKGPGGVPVSRVRMMSADIEYGCEYLGNSGRLVVRSLPCCIYAADFLLRVPFVCTAGGCSRMAKTRAPPGVPFGPCAGAEQNQLFQFVTEIFFQDRILP